jgi:hypothetical protein
MSGVSSSSINKTALPETTTTTANSSTFGTALNATPQKIAPSTKTKIKTENTVTINGVTMPRQPTQQGMATYYTNEQASSLLKKIPLKTYVPDNYKNNDILVGYDASGNAISTSHGAMASSTSNSIFHGKSKIEKLDISSADGRSYDFNKLLEAFQFIVHQEAKLQGKTTNTVDLSHVAVNISLGHECMALSEFTKAIKAITDRGGHVYQSAGNEKYNTHASSHKNITVVDATDDVIGGTISLNPKCSIAETNLCETPDKRNLDPSSSNIKAAQILITRVTKDGGVERKDKNSITGWMPFIDKSETEINKLFPLKEFEGSTPSSVITIPQLNSFFTFKNNLHKNNPTYLKDPIVMNKVDAEIMAEAKLRFGNNAVVPIQVFGLSMGWSLENGVENKLSVTLPNGVNKEDILVPFDRGFLKSKNIGSIKQPVYSGYNLETAEIPYYILDKSNKLKLIPPANVAMNDGTSWATPYALAETELGYRVQVEKARTKAKP